MLEVLQSVLKTCLREVCLWSLPHGHFVFKRWGLWHTRVWSTQSHNAKTSIALTPLGYLGNNACLLYQNRKLLHETDVASALFFLQRMWGSFCLPSQIRVTRKRKYRRDTPPVKLTAGRGGYEPGLRIHCMLRARLLMAVCVSCAHEGGVGGQKKVSRAETAADRVYETTLVSRSEYDTA